MASALCFSSSVPHLAYDHRTGPFRARGTRELRLQARKESSSATGETGSESENVVLRAAWYGSEVLGIVASFFRSAPTAPSTSAEIVEDGLGLVMGRVQVVEAIKKDFDRSYFVTGYLIFFINFFFGALLVKFKYRISRKHNGIIEQNNVY